MKRFLRITALSAVIAGSSAFAASFTILNSTQTVGASPTLTTGSGQTQYTDTFSGNTSIYTTFTLTGTSQSNVQRTFLGGAWNDQVDQNPLQSTAIGLNTTNTGSNNALWGFLGTFDLRNTGNQNLIISIKFANNTTQVVDTLSQYGGAFTWGFTSDTEFTAIVIDAGPGSSSGGFTYEGYTLDNVSVNAAPTGGGGGGGGGGGAVPEPSTFGLMGAAMVGLGVLRKVRR